MADSVLPHAWELTAGASAYRVYSDARNSELGRGTTFRPSSPKGLNKSPRAGEIV